MYDLVKKLSSRYSTGVSVVLCTLISIILSLFIGTFIIVLINKPDCRNILLLAHIVTPAIVAPLVTYPYIKLIREIDDLRRNLDKMARFDELTEISNRRHFHDQAQTVIDRRNRSLEPISLLFIDIDYFKQINDRYGHDIGDQTLKWSADILKSEIRRYDILARYGGEEFLILLPNTDSTEALQIAERISVLIRNSTMVFEEKKISITVSIGVSSKNEGLVNLDELIKDADNALYTAKDSGRNRVHFFSDSI